MWDAAFALVLELGMLFTPYPKAFGIPLTFTFVAVTLAAHLVFGFILGISVRRMWPSRASSPARGQVHLIDGRPSL